MTNVNPQRLTVSREGGMVVFLIGARVNKWWLIPVIWAVSTAMGRMVRQLLADPNSGLLGIENYAGRTSLMVQYWRSLDDLHRFSRDKQREHVPAWRRWIQSWGRSGAVGIWHETYVVEPGSYECFYHHMPAFGLGKVGPLVPADGPLKTAAGRLAYGRAQAGAAERAA